MTGEDKISKEELALLEEELVTAKKDYLRYDQESKIYSRFDRKERISHGIWVGLVLIGGLVIAPAGRYVSQNTTSLNPYRNENTAHYEKLLLAEEGLELLVNSTDNQESQVLDLTEVYHKAHENITSEINKLELDPQIETYRDWNRNTKSLAEKVMFGGMSLTVLACLGYFGSVVYHSRQRRRELAQLGEKNTKTSSPQP